MENNAASFDFFFGELSQNKKPLTLFLHDINRLAEQVSSEYFTGQLNRLLLSNGGHVCFTSDSSVPPFSSLISKLSSSAVGKIEIGRREDKNTEVPYTLFCKIYFECGVITVDADWCAYREGKASDLIYTLLVPLHKYRLVNKSYIIWKKCENNPQNLKCTDKNRLQEVTDILHFAQSGSGVADSEFINKMTRIIEEADNA